MRRRKQKSFNQRGFNITNSPNLSLTRLAAITSDLTLLKLTLVNSVRSNAKYNSPAQYEQYKNRSIIVKFSEIFQLQTTH